MRFLALALVAVLLPTTPSLAAPGATRWIAAEGVILWGGGGTTTPIDFRLDVLGDRAELRSRSWVLAFSAEVVWTKEAAVANALVPSVGAWRFDLASLDPDLPLHLSGTWAPLLVWTSCTSGGCDRIGDGPVVLAGWVEGHEAHFAGDAVDRY